MQHGVPAIGGLAIGAMFFIAAPLFLVWNGIFFKGGEGIMLASLVMLIFGVIDDRKNLSVIAKAVTQVIAALILVGFGVRTHIIYIGTTANIIITLIWVIGITNSFNHLDVMDGLAGIAAVICLASFVFLAIVKGDIFLIVLAITLLGGLCVFLKYNLPEAKIYLGNTGSHFIGFILAAMAMIVHYAPMERKVALISPLLILGLPIFDTAFVIFIRLVQGRSPFKKSNDHIATRLLKMNLSKWQALLLMSGWGLVCALLGISLTYFSVVTWPFFIAAAFILSAAIFLYAGKAVIND
jgi:UDP-GlcNAc:undecaprenyl-phosphate GlcNAc-1-phosphate transferase